MPPQLNISIGQESDKGRKAINQDFHGICIPKEPQLSTKGIAIALADGISSSTVSQVASETAVKCFLEDYFCTSDAWSVKKSAHQVLLATNSWLHSQTQQSQFRFDKDKGFVCTLSAMVIKSATAHIFHVGDSRIYRVNGKALEQLTNDHRVWHSEEKSYLSRAIGINPYLEIDYSKQQLNKGDIFIFATDGIYEFTSPDFIINAINLNANDLDCAAKRILKKAYDQGSTDNLTVQIIRIDELPILNADEHYQQLTELPFPPILNARMQFDGYTITRELHASSRSHVYLAIDNESNKQVVIKTPSIDLQTDPAYLERFLLEEWIARRITSAHVLKPCKQTRKRNYVYLITEYIDGQTLTQWIIDNPQPNMEKVRGIVEQIAKGLRAFHRLEMIHQDLRPDNIMIDSSGTVKIIDFGSAKVAGLIEIATPIEQHNIQGTFQYIAPEYLLGESGTSRSDLFSLGVITYQMLTGQFPYGTQVAKSTTKSAQKKLNYRVIHHYNNDIPAWVNEALRKAVHPNPHRRYQALSEFTFDLRHPNKSFLNKTQAPLLERDPIKFWKGLTFILFVIIIILLGKI